jgi:riboflavin biosynthesis pyrimidine reductase
LIVKELFPGIAEVEIDPKTSSLRDASHWYPSIPGIRFNYVINATGTPAENSDADSNELDRYFLRVIRSSSDLIITTGKTARSEELKASKLVPMAIITTQPNSLQIPATEQNSDQPVYVCSKVIPEHPFTNSEASWLETASDDIADIVREVIARTDSSNTVVEIGLLTFTALASEDLVNEVCLTVSNAESKESATKACENFLNATNVIAEQIQLLNAGTTWLFRFRVSQQSL